MESVTYSRADITFDGATLSNMWAIVKAGVQVEIFVKGEGVKIRKTSDNTLYIFDEETRVYITYPNPALMPADLALINGWVSVASGGGASESTVQEIADNTVRGIPQTETEFTLTSPTIVEIAPANPNRKVLKIYNNNGSPIVRFGFDSTLVVSRRLPAGGTNGSEYEYPQPVPTNAVYARANSGTSTIIVTEG